MSSASLERTPIVDRNGKHTVVLRKPISRDKAGGRSDKVTHTVNAAARELDAKIQGVIREAFPRAVEFRFDFQTDGETLEFFDRTVVDKSGELVTEESGDERLDAISNRLAEAYYETGTFGSRDIVRIASTNDCFVAIRLE